MASKAFTLSYADNKRIYDDSPVNKFLILQHLFDEREACRVEIIMAQRDQNRDDVNRWVNAYNGTCRRIKCKSEEIIKLLEDMQ